MQDLVQSFLKEDTITRKNSLKNFKTTSYGSYDEKITANFLAAPEKQEFPIIKKPRGGVAYEHRKKLGLLHQQLKYTINPDKIKNIKREIRKEKNQYSKLIKNKKHKIKSFN